MRTVFAIAKKELWGNFVTPMAYFLLTGFLLCAGYFFFNFLATFNLKLREIALLPVRIKDAGPSLNEWVVGPYFELLVFLLVFFVPMITMRLFAEERRSGTFEFLSVTPITERSLVGGKFLGATLFVWLLLFASSAFPILLVLFGNPEILVILTGLTAVLLTGAAFVAIGLAISCVTDNQVVAGAVSFVVLLILYFSHSLASSVGPGTAAWLLSVSPVVHAREMIQGVISLAGLVYFFSLIIVGTSAASRITMLQRST